MGKMVMSASIVHLQAQRKVIVVDGEGMRLTVEYDTTAQAGKAEQYAKAVQRRMSLRDACLDKLEPGEPFFVLRGRDTLSPALVGQWAEQAATTASEEKVAEAVEVVDSMLSYPGRRLPT